MAFRGGASRLRPREIQSSPVAMRVCGLRFGPGPFTSWGARWAGQAAGSEAQNGDGRICIAAELHLAARWVRAFPRGRPDRGDSGAEPRGQALQPALSGSARTVGEVKRGVR